MDAPASSEIFLFEGFRLDRRGGGLFRKDDADADAPVAVGSRALDILGVLIGRAGEVVSKDEIIAAVWPGTIVEDSNLTVQISALRRVLDQGRTEGSCIQTVPGRSIGGLSDQSLRRLHRRHRKVSIPAAASRRPIIAQALAAAPCA
jgi:DNA-binding winged helix-turn-helix (wHTH) protein